MLFVTVGSTEFDDLVEHVDRLGPGLGEPIICQVGHGSYVPNYSKWFRFAPTLEPYFRQSRLVIGHGGLGTAMEVVRLGKPFVGVSNPDRRDSHQDEILERLEAGGHLVWCRSLDDLADSIDRASRIRFSAYVEPECRIPSIVEDFLARRRPAQPARPRGF